MTLLEHMCLQALLNVWTLLITNCCSLFLICASIYHIRGMLSLNINFAFPGIRQLLSVYTLDQKPQTSHMLKLTTFIICMATLTTPFSSAQKEATELFEHCSLKLRYQQQNKLFTMAMVAPLHVQDNLQHHEELAGAREEPSYTEFNIFHDYFGLHTIVKSIAAENAPEEPLMDDNSEAMPTRRDSLGSSFSEFSSNSLESVEVADICYGYNQEVRAIQAFAENDCEPLSPLGTAFEPVHSVHTTRPNIPPSLFLNQSKLTTITTSQIRKPQVCSNSISYSNALKNCTV